MKLLTKIKRLLNIRIMTYENETFENETIKISNPVVFFNCEFKNCKIITEHSIDINRSRLIGCVIESSLYSTTCIVYSYIDLYSSINLEIRHCRGSLKNCCNVDLGYSNIAASSCKFNKVCYSQVSATNSISMYTGYSLSNGGLIPEAHPTACPLEGEFIAYKCVEDYIVKLLIPADAKRSSAFGFKCRASYAKVLSINHIKNGEPINSVSSEQYAPITYKVGEFVYPDSFDENRFAECSNGIHFFLNKEDAINYGKGLI